MRICLVTSVPIPPEEGLGFHVWNLARQLVLRGHRVSIITRGKFEPTYCQELVGIQVWRVTFLPIYPLHVHLHSLFANRLMAQIEEQFDLLHYHTPLPAVIKSHLPAVTTVHSPMRSDTAAVRSISLHALALRLQTPVSQQIEKALFHRSQKVTAVADWVTEALLAYGLPPEQVIVTGNGVEDCFFQEAPVSKKPWVLYAGRIEESKGLQDLVEAARQMLAANPSLDVRFVIAGKGGFQTALEHQIHEAGLQSYFVFSGYLGPDRRDELVHLYRQSTLFVLPSYHEGMPTVLLEAMACALPVISTAVGGAPQVIMDGTTGVLVPPHAPDQLAKAMLKLLADDSECRQMGLHAFQTTRQNFSWAAITQNYLSVYQDLLGIGSGKPL